MKLKIPNTEIQELLSGKKYEFPRYTTQLMNLANQNAQGTRARIVGQMSDLIQEFQGAALSDWELWYLEKHPEAIDAAAEKVYTMITLFKTAIEQIDQALVRDWIEELVIVKTFSGLKYQEAILKKIALQCNTVYRLAKPEEESRGIDGYIGEKPVSIKPITYKTKMSLNEVIDVPIVFYDKKKSEIVVEFDENEFL
ncbi:MjaI family restriction endonuclease [Emticicia sp. BO119]|uniref:MjaI family restriction endonuclease n=1 Tax=Emticicia sp. BO119 TaxID=2757768 RepID=UPI0015F06738|nr:MjaI family restriction endonuclease [Emticicia sp. BO119]MBA4852110.1 MjaI family restriction endonuclease [Emticicia sp. BO119]